MIIDWMRASYGGRFTINDDATEEDIQKEIENIDNGCWLYKYKIIEDPFYSEENQERLTKAIDDLNHGRNCAVHELIEEDEDICWTRDEVGNITFK